jgi:hypothetical protein
MPKLNANTAQYECPEDNCKQCYTTLNRLKGHYDRVHPRVQRPTWIVDTDIRQKNEQAKQSMTIVDGMTWREFMSAKTSELKETNPEITNQRVRLQMISEMWKTLKGTSSTSQTIDEPTMKPSKPPQKVKATFMEITKAPLITSIASTTNETPNEDDDNECILWIGRKNERLIKLTLLNGLELIKVVNGKPKQSLAIEVVEEVPQEPQPIEVVEEVQQEQEPIEVVEEVEQTQEPIEVVEEVPQEQEPIEVVEEVPQAQEPIEVVEEVPQYKPSSTIKHDEFLLHCCRTIQNEGFARAYHKLNNSDTFHIIPKHTTKTDATTKKTYTITTYQAYNGKNKTYQDAKLSDLREDMEFVYYQLCFAWRKYENSSDFHNNDEGAFNHKLEWLDVCHSLINCDNIHLFFIDAPISNPKTLCNINERIEDIPEIITAPKIEEEPMTAMDATKQAFLVKCCREFKKIGLAKAYHFLNDDKVFHITCTHHVNYDTEDGGKAHNILYKVFKGVDDHNKKRYDLITYLDVLGKLEGVYKEMCKAWSHHKTTYGFNTDDLKLFNEKQPWNNVKMKACPEHIMHLFFKDIEMM